MSTFRKAAIPISLIALVATISTPARAQTPCFANPGPDIIVGDIQSVSSFAVFDGIAAFAAGVIDCNIGTNDLLYQAASNKHPVHTSNLYRYVEINGVGRFEQVGMKWATHFFSALSGADCCACSGSGGPLLNSGCSSSLTSASNGIQLTTVGGLAPRFDINPHSGVFSFPYPFRNYNGSVPVTTITRRLQVHVGDIDPSLNQDANYFVENILIAPDDSAARNQNNNSSHRRVTVTRFGSNYSVSIAFPASTRRESPAIHAWQLLDPAVLETTIDTPEFEVPPGSGNNKGRLILAARATHLTGLTWHYEYSLFNMNSDRSVSVLSIPVPESAEVANIAFHDVDYHSGDGFNSTPENQINFDGTDWPGQRTPTTISWLMPAAQPVENSNALRWGTTYNFRFDADGPPARILATINLFKSAPGLPDTVNTITLAPVLPCLLGDLNHDGQVTPADIPLFIEALLEALPADPCPADLNQDGRPNGPDIQLFAAVLIP